MGCAIFLDIANKQQAIKWAQKADFGKVKLLCQRKKSNIPAPDYDDAIPHHNQFTISLDLNYIESKNNKYCKQIFYLLF